MAVPVSQMWTVASYVLGQKLKRRERYPLVLMLEPLFRCNLACAGCGKIQYPAHVLRRDLTPEECFAAVDECGAPVVSIPGGEPLIHPRIDAADRPRASSSVRSSSICARMRCCWKEKIEAGAYKPTKYRDFHLVDPSRWRTQGSPRRIAVCKHGHLRQVAVSAIREAARDRGFRVTSQLRRSTPARIRSDVARLFRLRDGRSASRAIMISPGYSYDRMRRDQDELHGTASELQAAVPGYLQGRQAARQ